MRELTGLFGHLRACGKVQRTQGPQSLGFRV